ncbi:MAG: hypothetical protein LBL96_01285 [Clostridiales bacterium]|nr:hypothetical protein [Clostridiales bacterium]
MPAQSADTVDGNTQTDVAIGFQMQYNKVETISFANANRLSLSIIYIMFLKYGDY